MQLRQIGWIVLLVSALLLSACGTTTNLGVTWKDPAYTKPINDVLVIGISKDRAARLLYEQEFANALRAHGVRVEAAKGDIPPSKAQAEAALKQSVEEGGYKFVLITHVEALDETVTHHAPRTYVAPGVYGGMGMYGYYGSSFQMVHQPAYTTRELKLKLETNLYDTSNNKLVWTAQSTTLDPTDQTKTIISVIKRLVKEMDVQGLLPNK